MPNEEERGHVHTPQLTAVKRRDNSGILRVILSYNWPCCCRVRTTNLVSIVVSIFCNRSMDFRIPPENQTFELLKSYLVSCGYVGGHEWHKVCTSESEVGTRSALKDRKEQ